MIDLAIIKKIADPEATPRIPLSCRQAAVAMVLSPFEASLQLLFILRARQEGDPWSGQMALPGGHRDEGDASLAATAARETLEETGLDLATHADFIGSLDGIRANPRSGIDLMVVPQVFVLHQEPQAMKPNYEVQKLLWGDVEAMYAGTTRIEASFPEFDRSGTFPGFQVEDQVVWGLTFRMLTSLFDDVRRLNQRR